jgi:hypothetical protein
VAHGTLAVLLALGQPAGAAEILVDSFCSLVEAIQAANNDDDAGGECPPGGSGADTLVLTDDVFLTEAFSGENGLPVITSEIVIEGGEFEITRSASAPPSFRILEIDTTGVLTLKSTTISSGGGFLLGGSGGGLLNRGVLAAVSTTISSNSTTGLGGGVFNVAGGIMDLEYVIVEANSSPGGGGGIFNGGTLTISDSVVRGNGVLDFPGGGIDNSGSLLMIRSTVSDNHAFFGGGLANRLGGFATLLSSTVSGNDASGGLDGKYGGGIYNSSSTLEIENSTISGNHASAPGFASFGGGIENTHDGVVTLTHTTVLGNSSTFGGSISNRNGGTVTITGSILTDSPTGDECFGTLADGGANFADDASCGAGFGTITDVDPALADNGGPTATHALFAGSSAIDAAGACGLARDQRDYVRDSFCDSGAFEFGAQPALTGEVDGLLGHRVVCSNRTTGQQVIVPLADGVTTWDCTAAGLVANPGDRIVETVTGIRP